MVSLQVALAIVAAQNVGMLFAADSPWNFPDCTHNQCESTKYDENAKSPMECESGFGELAPEFFTQLAIWQKKYGRESIKMSTHFLDDVWRGYVLPSLDEGLQTCPAAVLEIMMNCVLAVDTSEGSNAARQFLQDIYAHMSTAVESLPAGDVRLLRLQQLAEEWHADTAYAYPRILGLEPWGPRAELPSQAPPLRRAAAAAAAEEAAEDESLRLPLSQAGDPDICLGQRFYTYSLPDATLYMPGKLYCLHGQWGTEVIMAHYLSTRCKTDDPELADWFYVPAYATCRFVNLNEAFSNVSAVEIVDIMDRVAAANIWNPILDFLRGSRYYHRRQGLDHIFLFADGQGPRIWDSYDIWRAESVFMSPESKCPTWGESELRYTDVQRCLSSWKDIIIPGHTDYPRIQYMKKHNKPLAKRQLLMTFHGRCPGDHRDYSACTIRGDLVKLGKSFGLISGVDLGGFVENYPERKGDSHFCLVPAGTSPWTNHLYESFYAGCIPVILSDEYEVAFFDDLPWELFSIKWPESRVCSDPECRESPLFDYLNGLATESRDKLWQMKNALERYSCYFNWYSTDALCSPYFLIHRALQRLQRHRRPWNGRYWNADASVLGSGSGAEALDYVHLDRKTRFKSEGFVSFNFSWLDDTLLLQESLQ